MSQVQVPMVRKRLQKKKGQKNCPKKPKKPLKIKDFNVTLYIITPIGVDEIRSLSAVWNQHEVLNVINPKEKYTLTRDAMPSLCDGFHTPCG